MTTADSSTPALRLPRIETPLPPEEVVGVLGETARRGKLAGFRTGRDHKGAVLFEVTDFGTPLESVLVAKACSRAGQPGTAIDFDVHLKPTTVWVFWIVTVLSIWPGVMLVDSMLRLSITAYHEFMQARGWETWWWYVPLSVVGGVWPLLSSVRKSKASGRAEAAKVVGSIESILAARAGR